YTQRMGGAGHGFGKAALDADGWAMATGAQRTMIKAKQRMQRVECILAKTRGKHTRRARSELAYGAQTGTAQGDGFLLLQPQCLDRQATDRGIFVGRGHGKTGKRMRTFRRSRDRMTHAHAMLLEPSGRFFR